jgi:hypothetical protein
MQAARAKRIMEQETRKEAAPPPAKQLAASPVTDSPKPAVSAPTPKPVALAVATAIPAPSRPAAPARSRASIPRIKETPRAVAPAPAPVPTPAAMTPASSAMTPAPKVAVTPIFTTETKDCPNCWGKVPLATVRCRCGYEFSGGPQIPGLSISSSDFAEFFGDLGFTKPT